MPGYKFTRPLKLDFCNGSLWECSGLVHSLLERRGLALPIMKVREQIPPWLSNCPRKTFPYLCPIFYPSVLVGHSCHYHHWYPTFNFTKTRSIIVSPFSSDVSLPWFQHSQCDCLICCGLPFSSSPWISASIDYPGQSLFLFAIKKSCKKPHVELWHSFFIYSSAIKKSESIEEKEDRAGRWDRRKKHT